MRTALAALLLGAALSPALAAPALAAPALAAPSPAAAPATREVNQGYSIPVGGVTDLGALPVLGSLGLDFAHLLGQ
ncbi:hypothetical protein ACFWXO_21680 [Kitasatospora sp. NPDC059088]|uniref:hypothetical protein n=1 Tax=Kitasatospora sp. NPDC059088 TaxID=3346722 RepID=UPI0036BA8C5C